MRCSAADCGERVAQNVQQVGEEEEEEVGKEFRLSNMFKYGPAVGGAGWLLRHVAGDVRGALALQGM